MPARVKRGTLDGTISVIPPFTLWRRLRRAAPPMEGSMQSRAKRLVRALVAGIWLTALGCGPGVGVAVPQTIRDAAQQATKTYIQQTTIGDLFKVEASKLALEKTKDANIRAFAQAVIEEHGKSNRRLKDLVANAQLESQLPTGLDKDHDAKLDELRKVDGPAFDRTYLDMLLKGHENALTLHQTYARGGQAEALRTFAASAGEAVERHLVELRSLTKTAAGRS
jgi:putative membrane protein